MRTLSLGLIALMLPLSACATRQVITEVTPTAGNPRIVASRASVDTVAYAEAVKPEGGGVERTDITGWAVMPRPVLARILNENDRALAAVEEASAALAEHTLQQAVRLELARTCTADPVCKAEAAPRVARIIEGR